MSEFDRRLWAAREFHMDPAAVSPSGTWFAWYPVWGWDCTAKRSRRLWLERVVWFNCLGILMEYRTYSGSENEFFDKYGRYSWQ